MEAIQNTTKKIQQQQKKKFIRKGYKASESRGDDSSEEVIRTMIAQMVRTKHLNASSASFTNHGYSHSVCVCVCVLERERERET